MGPWRDASPMDQPLSAVSLGGGRWRENTTSLERCVAISGRTTEVPFTITELCCARSTGFPARRVTSGSTGICGPGAPRGRAGPSHRHARRAAGDRGPWVSLPLRATIPEGNTVGQHADVDVGPSHRAPGLRAPGLIRAEMGTITP